MKKRLLAFFAFFGCSFGLAALIYHAMALLTKGLLIFGFLPPSASRVQVICQGFPCPEPRVTAGLWPKVT